MHSLRQHIRNLEKSERRLKVVLRAKMDAIQELGAAGESARKSLVDANAALDRATTAVKELQGEALAYRNWWISEHCALESVLALVPPLARADVEHLVTDSRDRYSTFFSRSRA
jgi:hypothetical protein